MDAAPDKGCWIIFISFGVYYENVRISKPNVTLVGEGALRSVISGRKSVTGTGSTTRGSATVTVTEDGFAALGVGFLNTAGPAGNQAVALHTASDMAVIYECRMDGAQVKTPSLFSITWQAIQRRKMDGSG